MKASVIARNSLRAREVKQCLTDERAKKKDLERNLKETVKQRYSKYKNWENEFQTLKKQRDNGNLRKSASGTAVKQFLRRASHNNTVQRIDSEMSGFSISSVMQDDSASHFTAGSPRIELEKIEEIKPPIVFPAPKLETSAMKTRFEYHNKVVKQLTPPRSSFLKSLELVLLKEKRQENSRRRQVISKMLLTSLKPSFS